MKVICDNDIAHELRDKFTFDVPNAKYMAKFRTGFWDGKINLFSIKTHLIYAGLIEQLKEFAKTNDYDIEIDPKYDSNEFSVISANDWIKTLNLPNKFTPKEHQIKPFIYGVRNSRLLLLSATSSGKTLVAYLFCRWYKENILIIVPTVTLIHQLFGDFQDYGFDSEKYIHKLYEGQDREIIKPITVATWQTLNKLSKEWFNRFKVCIHDEAHLAQAACLKKIMENMTNCPVKIGMTGTLDGTETNKMVLEGLFGPVRQYTTTKKLMDEGVLAELSIKAIVLSYTESIRKMMYKVDYPTEIDFIVGYEPRNKFIKNLALSLEGNTLLLFKLIDKHGKMLYNSLLDLDRKVYYIHGGIEGEDRNNIRKIVENENNSIIVASTGTFSTGVNIPNLHNIIMASPYKSRIKVLQSIGRSLRIREGKKEAVFYDIVDDFQYKKKENITLRHFQERIKIYNEQKFNYKIYTVKLGD